MMELEFEQRRAEKASAMRLSRQMLFWAAAFSSLWGALYLLGLTGRLMIDGSLHSISSAAVQRISAAVALLWNVSLLIMFTALRRAVRLFKATLAGPGGGTRDIACLLKLSIAGAAKPAVEIQLL